MLPGEEKRNNNKEEELNITKSMLTYALKNEEKTNHELSKAKYMIDCLRKESKQYLDERQAKEKVLKELAGFIFDLYFKVKNNETLSANDFEKIHNAFELARSNQGYISLDELDNEKNKKIDEEINNSHNNCSCKD